MSKIRFANVEDIPSIMDFIRNHWKEEHILANNRDFFEYEHCRHGKVCFVIAENTETGEICGMEGFIPYSCDFRAVTVGMWKVLKIPGSCRGSEILRYIIENTQSELVCCVGINTETVRIYEYLGYYVGKLNHYYRIADRDEYKIAQIAYKDILPTEKSGYHLKKINFDELQRYFNSGVLISRKPFKDMDYIRHRYFEHPIYNYAVYAIKNNKTPHFNSILVCRKIELNGSKILRIVDFIGMNDEFAKISTEIQRLIDENLYEYVDFYCYGVPAEIVAKAGLVLKAEDDANIIPNYFEPFIKQNVEIKFFSTDLDGLCLFKADGDQDRPSLW